MVLRWGGPLIICNHVKRFLITVKPYPFSCRSQVFAPIGKIIYYRVLYTLSRFPTIIIHFLKYHDILYAFLLSLYTF